MVGGQRKTRSVESNEAGKRGDLLVLGGVGRYKYTRVHGPCVSQLGPRAGRATGYTFFRVSSDLWLPCPKSCPLRFAQLAMGYFNPPLFADNRQADLESLIPHGLTLLSVTGTPLDRVCGCAIQISSRNATQRRIRSRQITVP